jgi:hypothetical protein
VESFPSQLDHDDGGRFQDGHYLIQPTLQKRYRVRLLATQPQMPTERMGSSARGEFYIVSDKHSVLVVGVDRLVVVRRLKSTRVGSRPTVVAVLAK